MKIGVLCYPTYGGSGVIATELGKAFAIKNNYVHFISYNEPVRLDSLFQNIYYHEVIVPKYPLFDYLPYESALISKIVDVVKHEKLDLLHVHYAIPHAIAAYTAQQILKLQGIYIPFITTLHGTDITLVGKDHSFKSVISFAINSGDAITAVSESLKEETFRNISINKEINVIPNFIDIEQYKYRKNNELQNCFSIKGEKIIVHVSNFRKVKRIKDVIYFFEKLSKIKNVKLVMVGDGPERYAAEELCRKLELCDKVSFLGKVKNTEVIYSMADIFILPSENESFGLSILEAMACETAIISTDVGGISEVNQHGKSGYMSNIGDVDDMVKNALKILKSEENLKTFKLNARKIAKQFSTKNIFPIYNALYEKVIAENSKI